MYNKFLTKKRRKSDIGQEVTLAGWVQKIRDKGFII